MRTKIKLTVVLLTVFTLFQQCGYLEKMKQTDALVMGKLYYLSNPLKELDNYQELDAFLNLLSEKVDLEKLFSGNGYYTKKLREVGEKFIEMGVKRFSLEEADAAFSKAVSMGATPDQATSIRNDYNNKALDFIAYGKELVWLSEVLPEYIKNNKTPFMNTGTETRQTVRVFLPQVRIYGNSVLREFENLYQDYLIYLCAVMIYDAS